MLNRVLRSAAPRRARPGIEKNATLLGNYQVFESEPGGLTEFYVPLLLKPQIWLGEYLHKGRPLMVRDPSERHVFLSQRGYVLSRQYMAQLVRLYAKKIGLDKVVTPHVLRHCCATHMLRRGAGLRHLQALLGHESLDTTGIYTRIEVSDLAEVIQRCHPRERPET